MILGLLGLVFGGVTGALLVGAVLTELSDRVRHQTGTWDELTRWVLVEVTTLVFLLSASALIWAVATPKWIERWFAKYIGRFLILLLFISLGLLGIVVYAMMTGL